MISGGSKNITVFQDWRKEYCCIKPAEAPNQPGGQYDLLIVDGGRKLILAIEAKISANQVSISSTFY